MTMYRAQVVDSQLLSLSTVSTASGAIASFNTDLTENLIEVVCDIQYSQASGTPTPSDPLPIMTYTSLNLSHSGKNFAPNDLASGSANGVTYTVNADKSISLSGTATATTYLTIKNGIYLPAGVYTAKKTDNTNISFRIRRGSTEGTDIMIASLNDSTASIAAQMIYVVYRISSGTNTDGITLYPQVERGSESTNYEPFGTTVNIPFGQTVAKGTLNVTTGVLEITHSEYVFDGTEIPIAYGSGYRYVVLSNKEGKKYGQDEMPNLICNEYNAITRRQIQNGSTGVSITGNTILLSSNTPSGVQVVYELATPIIVQLSPIQIRALLNENNIWCDTGDTEVKFLLTVGKKIS